MPVLDQFARDVRFGIRSLVKTPGFTALAILSLGLGIMTTTAIYSVLHAVVLDPFPYRDVASLNSVLVTSAAQRGGRNNYSIDQFLELADRSTIFDGVVASTVSDVLWSDGGEPRRLRGNHGTFNTFDVMGVPPLIGRTPGPADAQPGATPVVVLGYRFWHRQFGGDPNVLGRQLQLNDVTRTVIGVMPKRFMWRGADVYLPTRFERGRTVEDVRSVHLLGRVKAGVTGAQVESDLGRIIADLKAREPAQFPDQWRVRLVPFTETFPSGIRGDVWVLFSAVSLLLMIACANVSNLLLSRAADRQREMTVRIALGASRARLVRQLLTESLLLALAAGVAGTLLAYLGLPGLLALVPPDTIPDEAEIAINAPVLLFSLGISALASVLCGLAPALFGRSGDVATALRGASRSVAGTSTQARLRKALVVIEVGLSLVLLVGCSLLARSYLRMQAVTLPVPPNQILTMRVPLPSRRYPDGPKRAAFFSEVLDRVAALPGVSAAGVNTGLHPLGNQWTTVEVAGAPVVSEPVVVHQINAGYQSAIALTSTSGRLLAGADVRTAAHVAVINDRFVKTHLAGRPPLGQVVHIPRIRQPPFNLADDSFQIVGVVRDVPNNGLSQPVMPEMYLPFTTTGLANRLVIRTASDASVVTRSVIDQVHAVDPNQPVDEAKRLDVVLAEDEYATPRFSLVLFLVFGVMGLVLAVVGVYGVMATAVAQQRHEIGVRLALGAERGRIVRMIVGRGARLLLAGVAVGLVASVVAARFIAGQIWNVAAFDPLAFATVALILFAAGLQACLWPARRAGAIDPIIALRVD